MVSMRLASLFTGGKDSTYATHLAGKGKDHVTHLVTMIPQREDSWMFHAVNIQISELIAKALGIDQIKALTSGEKERELDDLRNVLNSLDIDGVVSGAIASTYQRTRIEHLCQELELIHKTPLWGRNCRELLEEMISTGLVFVVSSIAARGLGQKWLGRIVDSDALCELIVLGQKFGLNLCGEGGEMETLVLDAPWFSSKLEVLQASKLWDGMRGSYIVEKARLQPKN